MPRTDLYIKVELDLEEKEEPERVANESPADPQNLRRSVRRGIEHQSTGRPEGSALDLCPSGQPDVMYHILVFLIVMAVCYVLARENRE